jgi:hypothetical protein
MEQAFISHVQEQSKSRGMKSTLKLSFLIFFVIAAFSCKNQKKGTVFLPNVTGKAGEVMVVMENTKWKKIPGETTREKLAKEIIHLPVAEPMFDVFWVSPDGFNKLAKPHRNIIIAKINPRYKKTAMKYQKDVYAKPQVLLDIIAPSDTAYARFLEENAGKIRSIINTAERKRLISYYNNYQEEKVVQKLVENHSLSLVVPKGYTLDVNEKDFVWISHETPELSQGILIYTYPYQDENTFTKEFLIEKRNEVLKENVPGPSEGSYMTTEDEFPPIFQEITYKERYFAQLYGLWRIENDFMGGPFVNFTTLDNKRDRVISLDGYVYAPKQDKREYLRQVESILYTLKVIP